MNVQPVILNILVAIIVYVLVTLRSNKHINRMNRLTEGLYPLAKFVSICADHKEELPRVIQRQLHIVAKDVREILNDLE